MIGKIAIFMLVCSTTVSPVYIDQGYQPVMMKNQAIESVNSVTLTPEVINEQPKQAAESIKPVTAEPAVAEKVISINRDKTREQLIAEAFDRVYKRLNAKFEETRLRDLGTKFNEI